MNSLAIHRQFLCLFFLLTTSCLFSQPFVEQKDIALKGLFGPAAFGDFNNDKHLDFIISGQDAASQLVSKIYLNNGNNTFTDLIPLNIGGFKQGSVDLADFNNDGHLDILLTGSSSNAYDDLIIYRNNGDSTFTELPDIIIPGIATGTAKWGDFNNDGYQDILITGYSSKGDISKIYQNINGENFIERADIEMPQLSSGSMASWCDFNNDGYLDFILTGQVTNSLLYQNNDGRSFTRRDDIPLGATSYGSIDWGDYDNDGYSDLLLTGNGMHIYHNNENNTFSDYNIINYPYSAGWGDHDNDGDLDILYSGRNRYYVWTSSVLRNNGNNSFTDMDLSLADISAGSITWGDYDNDRDLDILVSGFSVSASAPVTKLFQNQTTFSNTPPSKAENPSVSVSGADVFISWSAATDNEQLQEGLTYNIRVGTSPGTENILSANAFSDGIRKLNQFGFANDTLAVLKNLSKGNYYFSVQAIDNGFKGGQFSEEESFTIIAENQASDIFRKTSDGQSLTIQWQRGNGEKSIVFAKKANNGNLLLLADNISYISNASFGMGSSPDGEWYCVYNGTGNEIKVNNMEALTEYMIQVVEYEGSPGNEHYFSSPGEGNPVVYKTSAFTLLSIIAMGELQSVEWCDFNNDGLLDIFTSGGRLISNSYVYKNNGDLSFTKISIGSSGIYNGSHALGDYNNDGLIDFLISGLDYYDNSFTALYKNTGGFGFEKQEGSVFAEVSNSSVSFIDYDNDGDLDILISGYSNTGPLTKIYRNENGNSFTDQSSISIIGVKYSAHEWADYNKDGFPDLVITGQDKNSIPVTKIYQNTGSNDFFKEIQTNLPGVSYGSVSFTDLNHDGKADILLSGLDRDENYVAGLYVNLENGFTKTEDYFYPVIEGFLQPGDYDNDGDMDIMISGNGPNNFTYRSDRITQVYENFNDTFTLQSNIILPGAYQSMGSWGDFDRDNDLDLLLFGYIGNQSFVSVHRNNIENKNDLPEAPSGLNVSFAGRGVQLNWLPVTNDLTPSEGLSFNLRVGTTSGGSDIISPMSDSDGFRKLTRIGNASYNNYFLLNDLSPGTYYWTVQAIDNGYAGGAFATENSFTVDSVQVKDFEIYIKDSNSLNLKWERGNGDRCIVFGKSGSSGSAFPVNGTTYIGESDFGEGDQISGTGWHCLYNGKGTTVTVTGLNPSNIYTFHVMEYIGTSGSEEYYRSIENNILSTSTGSFTDQSHVNIKALGSSLTRWIDYDNDGDLDILLTGWNGTVGPVNSLYRNEGDNTFTEIPGVLSVSNNGRYGVSHFGDIDNDGDMDLLIVDVGVKIFINNSGTFAKDIINSFPEFESSYFGIWLDFDNDGSLDLAISGNGIIKLYRNNGNGTFLEKTGVDFPKIWYNPVLHPIDYNNDGFIDLICKDKIYKNNGEGSFAEVPGISFSTMDYGYISSADYNNDGFTDVLITGRGTVNNICKLYKNIYGESFIEVADILSPGIYLCASDFGDYDNDGDLDLAICGTYEEGYPAKPITKIFKNENGSFIEDTKAYLPALYESSIHWGDYDNDGDMDLLISGITETRVGVTKVFRNNLITRGGSYMANLLPSAPEGLEVEYLPQGILMKWNPVEGDETAAEAMSYNVCFRHENNDNWAGSPHSDIATGYRKLNGLGNAQLNESYLIKNAEQGKYYWKVQAIDQGFKGGEWSALDSFMVENTQAFFLTDTVCQGYPTHFTDQSVAADGIAFWHWDFSDGNTSDTQNPEHTFADYGSYMVKLVITSTEGDKDSLIQGVIVKTKPLVDFTASLACQGSETVLTNLTDAKGLNINSWSWDYGDGKGSILQDPGSHGYLVAGDFQLTLYALADNGCEGSLQKTVTVGAYPVAVITASTPLSFCDGDSVILSVGRNTDYTYRWLSGGVGITNADQTDYTAKFSGNYAVEVVNTRGNCVITSAPVTVTMMEMPADPVIITSDYTPGKCMSDNPVTLSVDQPVVEYNYQWKRNGVIVSDAVQSSISGYLPAGDYSVVATISTCKAESAIKTISYDEAPAKPLIHAEGPVVWYLACSNNSAAQYKWYFDGTQIPGANKYIYVANQDIGEYYVSIANERGCFTSSDVIKIPPDAIGIDETDVFSTMNIFPNPTTGLFTIVMDNQLYGDIIISVFTEKGKMVWNTKFDKSPGYFSCEIELSGQGSGVFLVNLKAGKNETSRKVLVE